jgi:hypothetical protein
MTENFKRIFDTLQNASSPLAKGDHPELDTSDLLDMEASRYINP